MRSVSLLELRRDTATILRRVRAGEPMILTVRGKPVMRLEPIAPEKPAADDPFYRLASRAVKNGVSLSNKQMDKIIYGT